ncbi:MAG TPA: ChaB family protein [Rhizomicrobium sp.]|nr:ChaB family protein [Rhizomicrobium sp.]
MPYERNTDLPLRVRVHLPDHAQSIFRAAFNHAWQSYADAGTRREEIAHRVAWSAVKKVYRKVGNDWVRIGSHSEVGA